MKPENTFIKRVNKQLPKDVYCLKTNNPYTAGVSDCWYSSFGGDLWIEYKWLGKITNSVTAKLTELQKHWLNLRWAEGRNVACIVGSPQGALVLIDGEWNEAKETATNLLSVTELATWIKSQVKKV